MANRAHERNLSIIQNLLNTTCKKICRLFSQRKFATTKYQKSLELHERKKEEEKYSYHNDRSKRIKRLTNKMKMYHEDKLKSIKKKQN